MRIINHSTKIIYVDSSLTSSGSGESPNSAFNSLEEALPATDDIDVLIVSSAKPYHIYKDHVFFKKLTISYNGPDKATIMINSSSISWHLLSTFKMTNIVIKSAGNSAISKPFLIFASILESSDYEIEVFMFFIFIYNF